MFKPITNIAAAAVVALSLASMGAHAAGEPSQNAGDLASHSCKDLMRLTGQDRDVALALAHGYVLGKKGTTKFQIDALGQITDKFIDYCLDHPKENALASFEKIAR